MHALGLVWEGNPISGILTPNALSPIATIEMTLLPHWVIHLLKVLFGRNSA